MKGKEERKEDEGSQEEKKGRKESKKEDGVRKEGRKKEGHQGRKEDEGEGSLYICYISPSKIVLLCGWVVYAIYPLPKLRKEGKKKNGGRGMKEGRDLRPHHHNTPRTCH